MSIKEFFDKLIIGEISPDCDISVGPFKTIDHIELSQTLVAGTTTIQASPHCQIIESTKWILKPSFDWLREPYNTLIIVILNYVSFLNRQNKITTKNHASITRITIVRKIEQAITIKIHKTNTYIMPNDEFKYNRLENAHEDLSLWIPIDIENYLPIDPV
ncbi:hypothetical protein C2G38_2235866 [Gigaspora rosea]|uniref:Uncharacterized protein n=1 Tax=Gigaspora rosea TaxID=44941 RepID=A0A397TYY2_9GLOM|nr:hypothetical protein C2G38_2235866 [Gigaspora rosea]